MKTTEQLAEECNFKKQVWYAPDFFYGATTEELEAFRAACIKDYFDNAEPVACCDKEGRLRFESVTHGVRYGSASHWVEVGTKLFAAPKDQA